MVTRQQRIQHAYCAFPDLPTRSTNQISMCRPAPNQRRLITSAILSCRFNSQDAPRHQHEEVARKPLTENHTLSQSEHDWAFADVLWPAGTTPTEVIRRIADYRADDKHDPEYYARHTVQKALAGLQQRFAEENGANERPTREIDRGDSP